MLLPENAYNVKSYVAHCAVTGVIGGFRENFSGEFRLLTGAPKIENRSRQIFSANSEECDAVPKKLQELEEGQSLGQHKALLGGFEDCGLLG